jgi:hypothetical protein
LRLIGQIDDGDKPAMTMSIQQAAIDLAVAGGLSSLIGFERQWRNRLAGLRTNSGGARRGELRDL